MRINKTHTLHTLTILLCSLIPFTTSSETTTEIDQRVSQSREAVKFYADVLIAELKYSLEEGGPVRAIKVCKVEAPQIAKDISDQNNWRIGRTSLKTRNPKNNPDEWEAKVLQQFEQRKQNGGTIATLEFSETTKEGFRYMKAIPTKGLCLTCHGETLAEPVKATLEELYPEDKATGFKVGDIRGAFSIIQK
jgi:Protein of unknown function (DUF3365)